MNPIIGQRYIFCFDGGQFAIAGEVISAEPGARDVRDAEGNVYTINLAHVVHYRHATK